MKIFDKEFLESMEQETPQQARSMQGRIRMEQLPILAASPSAAREMDAGCGESCGCGAAAEPAAGSFEMDAAGIKTMLATMLVEMDPDIDRSELDSVTESPEWQRLENIQALSKMGDGWDDDLARESLKDGVEQLFDQKVDRRTAVKMIATGLLAGYGLMSTAWSPFTDPKQREMASMNWKEYFKGNFRLMSDEEKQATVGRLERMYEINTGSSVTISAAGPQPDVLYGYAFNISKCRGYMDCIKGCLQENNQDRKSDMRYIRIHEHKQGQLNFDEAEDDFYHEVPAAGHFYVGTQCFHCENPPCVPVCPVKATWKEPDGIVVVDYDWCIGCRYCIAACPYDARRFNWADPVIPASEVNKKQHYLGNRLRKKGVTEKCTFCIQRTREGQNPACVEACPTGARIFGNLLDPNSEIRWVLANKKVFRLKEDLGTEPKFWYFMD